MRECESGNTVAGIDAVALQPQLPQHADTHILPHTHPISAHTALRRGGVIGSQETKIGSQALNTLGLSAARTLMLCHL